MSFTLTPDDGPHRIVRYVAADKLPTSRTVALLDERKNVLLVNYHLFQQLDPSAQDSVLKTRDRCVEIN